MNEAEQQVKDADPHCQDRCHGECLLYCGYNVVDIARAAQRDALESAMTVIRHGCRACNDGHTGDPDGDGSDDAECQYCGEPIQLVLGMMPPKP